MSERESALITGATGLIGSHLTRRLAKKMNVFATARRPEAPELVHAGATYIPLDMSKEWSQRALPDGVSTVIHLAQSEHFRDFPKNVGHVLQVNTHSTVKLLDYARRMGARTFILASTGGVYGWGDRPLTETQPMSEYMGFYAASKYAAETLADAYRGYFHVITLRFFFVYGVGQAKHMLIPRLIANIRENKTVTLAGENGIRINPIHVEDSVDAIVGAMRLEQSAKINIGGPEALNLRQIANAIGQAVGKPPAFDVHKEAEQRHLVGDIRRMIELLSAPKTKFRDGILQVVQEEWSAQ
ncbi:MAG: NAD(P)-dependent oxidoreductase [Armatimonadetes bacterium]|nr:NAD(P)-dependent oxidoreductase [Armatimonadota bacterium]